MENKASRLSVNNLNKYYGAVQAVKDFSITVEPGEFLVLLGLTNLASQDITIVAIHVNYS